MTSYTIWWLYGGTDGSLLQHSWGFEHFGAFYKGKTLIIYFKINKYVVFNLVMQKAYNKLDIVSI